MHFSFSPDKHPLTRDRPSTCIFPKKKTGIKNCRKSSLALFQLMAKRPEPARISLPKHRGQDPTLHLALRFPKNVFIPCPSRKTKRAGYENLRNSTPASQLLMFFICLFRQRNFHLAVDLRNTSPGGGTAAIEPFPSLFRTVRKQL